VNLKTLTAIFLIIPSSALAQWLSDIKTESDWEYCFLNGFIDYNSYQLLREIAEGAEVKDTSEFIISTLGISSIELTEIYEISDTRKTGNEKWYPPKTGLPWSGRLRFGNKIQDRYNESYMLVSARSKDTNIYLKIRNDDKEKLATERRSFEINRDNYSVTLGNFAADIGCGLSLGRFDYRPVSLESDESELNQFLFPDNSFYNGVKAEFLRSHSIVYSIKKYNDLYKNTLGTSLSAQLRSFRIGIVGAFTRLSSGSYIRTLAVGSVFIDLGEIGAKAEIAYGESGPGACVQVAKPDFFLRGWYYDESYINLQSSGYSHPDYQSYPDYHSEISFRQPQRGESGFFVRKKIKYKNLEFKNAAEFWRNPRTDYINCTNSFQTRIFVSPDIRSLMRYSMYDKNNKYQSKIESGIQILKSYDIEARVLLVYESKTIIEEDSKFYIMTSFPLTKSMSLAGRMRWRFDGEFDYFIEERLVLNNGLFLKATYRWKENRKKDLDSLYVFLENRF